MRQEIYKESIDGIFIERVVRDFKYSMPTKHSHEEYEIYYLVKGDRDYFIDTQYYHITEGSLVFINSNSIHKTSAGELSYHDRISIELCSYPFSSFFESTDEFNLAQFFTKYQGVLKLTVKEQQYVYRILHNIAVEIHHKDCGCHLTVMCLLTELLLFSKRKFDKSVTIDLNNSHEKASTHQLVAEVASYISQNYSSSCSLSSLATKFFINKSYLSRIFKESNGYTITEYINISRIQASKKLLAQDDLSIHDVAIAVGYTNLTYFERMFCKITETSPLKYRKQLRHLNPKARPKTYKSEEL